MGPKPAALATAGALPVAFPPEALGSGHQAAKLVVLSDTHVPARAKGLPSAVWAAIEAADLVVHAGDWVSPEFLEEMRARSRVLLGVAGNNDHGAVVAELPQVAHAIVAGVRLATVHDSGPAKGRESRAEQRFPDTDLLIFGHSHIPWDTVSPRGLRLLNPGSPTDRRRQPSATFLTVSLAGARIVAVRLHQL